MTSHAIQLHAGANASRRACRRSAAADRPRLRAWAEVLVLIALALTALLGAVSLGSLGVEGTPASGPAPGLGL